MGILYSKTAHTTGGSGFFLDTDKNAPADAFSVSSADHTTAINLNITQPGATYDFSTPVAPATVGTLVITTPTAAQIAAVQTAKALADFQQSARNAITATQGTFDRITEAVLTGKVAATDPTVQAWYAWRTATRTCITATVIGILPAKPTYYPTGT